MTSRRGELTTFLFTTLAHPKGSSEDDAEDVGRDGIKAHHRLLSDAAGAHGGRDVRWMGDGLVSAFTSAVDAVQCAIAMQESGRRLAGRDLSMQVGLHCGEATGDESDYFGAAVTIARRICEHAEAGQILASGLVSGLLSSWSSLRFGEINALELKGIGSPIAVCELLYDVEPFAMMNRIPFVGRGEELAHLTRRMSETVQGRGGVVMLAGEAGIGKTRLAEQFAEQSRSQGATVIAGRCYEGDWAPPFSPFVEAIGDYQAVTDAALLHEDLGWTAPTLARLVPAIRERLPDTADPATVAPEEERPRLLEAVSRLFAGAAARTPVLLMLDDLHWADTGTVAMLTHLGREAKSLPLLILGVFRDAEAPARGPLADSLASLRRDSTLTQLKVGGLDPGEVGNLLRIVGEQDVPETFVSAIVNETEGNPLFIREMLIHLIEEGRIGAQTDSGGWPASTSVQEIGVPEGVRDVIARRVVRLSEPCRRMLTVASAMSAGFTWDVLRSAASMPEDTLLNAFEEALRARIIVERVSNVGRNVAGSGGYDFAHALIRHTLYEEMSTPRRLWLHRQIGEAIEVACAANLTPHLSELAYHFGRADPDGDISKAVEYGQKAGDAALAVYAYDDALRHYERAIGRLSPQPEQAEARRANLLLALGKAQSSAGDEAAAKRSYLAAADDARALGSGELLARAALGYGREWDSGTVDASILELLQEALAALDEREHSFRSRVLAGIANALLSAPEQDRIDRLTGEAITIARQCDDADALMFALHSRHFALGATLGMEERLAIATELIDLAKRRGDMTMLMQGQAWRVGDLFEKGESDAAYAEAAAWRPQAVEMQLSLFLWYAAILDATRALLEGRAADAERLMAEALSHGQKLPNQNALQMYGAQMFALRWHQGRLVEIEPMFKGLAQQFPTFSAFGCALAFLYAEVDRREDARREFDRIAEAGFSTLPKDLAWMLSLSLLAQVSAYLGDDARCAELYDMLLPYAERNVTAALAGACNASCHRYLGQLCAARERWSDAERHYEAALRFNERLRARPHVAHTQFDHARMLLARNEADDGDRARSLLAKAAATAVELQMQALAAAAQSRLDGLAGA